MQKREREERLLGGRGVRLFTFGIERGRWLLVYLLSEKAWELRSRMGRAPAGFGELGTTLL